MLRAAAIVCAAVVVIIIGIEVWKRWLGGVGQAVAGDYVFFAVLIGLLAGLLLLCRAITRELRRSQGP
jgi:surface polysaccharide O-acyltransferase-like enzyme